MSRVAVPASTPEWSRATVSTMWSELQRHLPSARQLRHEIHQNPDLSGQEQPTLKRLREHLPFTQCVEIAGGCIARIGTQDLPAVALRAELDALPLTETSQRPWASTNGAMHACGHDVHLAALVSVLTTLAAVGPIVPVIGLLQPREETVPSGAPDLLSSPEMAPDRISHVIGAHVQPRLAVGTFSSAGGAINAAVDDFEIRVRANGGHGGYPHTTGDPILAAASIVTSIQGVVARSVDPMHPAVVTVGSLSAGRSPNVIPKEAVLAGTIRSFDEGERKMLRTRLDGIAQAMSTAYGCEAEVSVLSGEPILRNDEALATSVTRWVSASTSLTSAAALRSCGADDFAFYCEQFPSLMTFVGVGQPGSPGLHHEAFAPSDRSIDDVAATLLASYLAACEMRLGPLND